MKKSTCKYPSWSFVSKKDTEKLVKRWAKLAMVGAIFVIFGAFIIFMGFRDISKGRDSMGSIYVGIGIFVVGFTLIFLPSSMKKSLDKEELRKAQLKALEKGKVNITLKGKMRKLK
jgi:uncharacterized membrane protein